MTVSEACCSHDASDRSRDPRYRRVLWIALAINAAMFAVEIGASFRADSVSLLADSVDFLGDAANYALSLGAIALGSAWQSRAAIVKGISMGAYGFFVFAFASWNLLSGSDPQPMTMGVIGFVALTANLAVAALLYAYREGNANMRSVWLCTRNDAIGNLAVMVAAAGVFGTGSAWPDLFVAGVLSLLAVSAAVQVLRRARSELRHDEHAAFHH
jgi:Co/Zn/Cd efflux system component